VSIVRGILLIVCVFVPSAYASTAIDAILSDALMIERVKTGTQVDINVVASLKNGRIENGYVSWEDIPSKPEGISLTYAINGSGEFYVGAKGEVEPLLQLFILSSNEWAGHWTGDTGLNTTLGIWENPVYVPPEEMIASWLNLDEKSNRLVTFLRSSYFELKNGGAIISGNVKEGPRESSSETGFFEELDFSIKNNMGNNIDVVASLLFMYQSTTKNSSEPDRGYPIATSWPWWSRMNAYNKKWNPKSDDTVDGTGWRTFNISSNGDAIFMHAGTRGDNGNSGYVEIDGNRVSSFSNWQKKYHYYDVFNSFPNGEIKLYGANNWAGFATWFSAVVLGGDIEISDIHENPTGGISNNPAPLRYTIYPGWNGVDAATCVQEDDVKEPNCDGKVVSDLKFIINDEVVGEEWFLAPPTFLVGRYLEVKLQEDLRVCNRHKTVDLWIALEMPDGTHLFLVSGTLGPEFSFSPAPFKTDLQSGRNAHSVLSFEIPLGMGGEYHFYAGYTLPGKDISDFLFTLRSNRAALKVILPNS
jgi:hypothetical protein